MDTTAPPKPARRRVQPHCVKESLEELRLNEESGYRPATPEQKELYAALLELPITHFLVQRLSKGEANRAIREAQKKDIMEENDPW